METCRYRRIVMPQKDGCSIRTKLNVDGELYCNSLTLRYDCCWLLW